MSQKRFEELGIRSDPPYLTVDDIDRFFRLHFNQEKKELPWVAVVATLTLTQPPEKLPPNFRLFDEAPFPWEEQSDGVRNAIIMQLWRRNREALDKCFPDDFKK